MINDNPNRDGDLAIDMNKDNSDSTLPKAPKQKRQKKAEINTLLLSMGGGLT